MSKYFQTPSQFYMYERSYYLFVIKFTLLWKIAKIIINIKYMFICSEKLSCVKNLKDEIKYFSTQCICYYSEDTARY
jgi:hypothetical protein